MSTTTSYLDRLLEPMTEALTPEVARKLVSLRADAQMQSRIEELRKKSNDGELTAEEEAEYKEFVEALDIVAIIQSKARKFLNKQTG